MVTVAEANVIAALLALTGVLAGLWTQTRRVHKDNRADHGETVKLVRELRADIREIKADIHDVKDELRSHGTRLRVLEHLPIEFINNDTQEVS